jgi:hypothetical protein
MTDIRRIEAGGTLDRERVALMRGRLLGEELNHFYRRREDGTPEETHHEVVREGTGVAMLPDDLHSIQIAGGGMNFHMYGLALDRLDERVYFSEAAQTWKRMGAFGIIKERAWRPTVAEAPIP